MWSPAFAVSNVFEISGPIQTFCWFAILLLVLFYTAESHTLFFSTEEKLEM